VLCRQRRFVVVAGEWRINVCGQLVLMQDASFGGDGQSAISAYDRMLQDKERVILE
jgi:hypothetical protein